MELWQTSKGADEDNMAVNPNSSARFTAVSGGTSVTVLSDHPTNFVRLIVPGTYVGTIAFDDAATATGTTSTSQILSLGLPNTNVAGNIEVGVHSRKGLVYTATGTPVMTIVTED